VTFWYGSEFCFFRQWPSRWQQKIIVFLSFLLITFWRYIYIIFQRKKAIKSQNRGNQGFSCYYFCLMIEGSGSGRSKNIRIRITVWNSVKTKGTQDRFPIELIIQCAQDDFLLRHYDSGTCQGKLGHSRASVIWHRTQVPLKLTVYLYFTRTFSILVFHWKYY